MSEVINEFLKPRLTRGTNLRFTPYSWAKLLYLRDIGPTEVGGYAITGTDDPLLITDLALVKQECTSVTIEFDKQDSVDFMEKMVDKGLSPWMHQSIFWHTHPGNCATPSTTDEDNFNKNFSLPDCAIFFIIARGGDVYCRMRYNVGPGTEVKIDSMVDYSIPFPASNKEEWEKEYKDKVTESKSFVMMGNGDSNLDWINKWRETHDHVYPNGTMAQTIQELCDEKDKMDEDLEMFWDSNEDCVWFWNDEEEDHWKYSPIERAFFDADDSRISIKNIPKECKISEVIRFGVKCYKDQMQDENSFLKEIEKVELCQ